ncbi:hypothetical protein AAHE18_03G230200 [Arachis hypogaea]
MFWSIQLKSNPLPPTDQPVEDPPSSIRADAFQTFHITQSSELSAQNAGNVPFSRRILSLERTIGLSSSYGPELSVEIPDITFTPSNTELAKLVAVLTEIVQEGEVPISIPILVVPSSSTFSSKLSQHILQQLSNLLKLSKHTPSEWTIQSNLNSLLSDILSSSLEL